MEKVSMVFILKNVCSLYWTDLRNQFMNLKKNRLLELKIISPIEITESDIQ